MRHAATASKAPVAPPEALYGSHLHSLVWGFLFEPQQPARHVDSDEASQLIAPYQMPTYIALGRRRD